MKPIIRNVFAVIVGLIVGGLINGGLITIGGSIIPPPEGTDVTTVEGLKKALPLFQPKHYIFPFLAHAVGSLSGAYIAARLAGSRRFLLAIIVSVIFFFGGLFYVVSLPSPIWFSILDLVGAYLPMGWLGAKLAERKTALVN